MSAAVTAREGREASAGAKIGERPTGFGISGRPPLLHYEPDEVVSAALIDENQTTWRGNKPLGYPMGYLPRCLHVADQIVSALL